MFGFGLIAVFCAFISNSAVAVAVGSSSSLRGASASASAGADAAVQLVSIGDRVGYVNEWELFNGFIERFEKKYPTLEDFESRFSIFRSNVRTIISHNMDPQHNFTLGVNAFTDLSPQEFKEKYTGGWKKGAGLSAVGADGSVVAKSSCKAFTSTNAPAGDTLDWTTKGAVTPVKNQGQCGSCWSFSATGAMEGAWFVHTGKLVSLSEEQLVECSKRYGNLACNGGMMDNAFQYAIDNGMCSEAAYPYTSGTGVVGSCKTCQEVVTMSSCADVATNNQVVLKAAVSMAPVSIAIEADTAVFQSYSGGVITSAKCGTTLDHGVLIAGYGVENGIKYWLVKNSWGPDWGLNGYVKIGRSDSTNDAGICGIAMEASFPIV